MAIGGTVGGVSAYRMSQGMFEHKISSHCSDDNNFRILGQFRSVGDIIRNDLTTQQKEKLMEHVMASVRDLEVTDAAILLPMLVGSASIQQAVLSSVVSFIGNELSLQVID